MDCMIDGAIFEALGRLFFKESSDVCRMRTD